MLTIQHTLSLLQQLLVLKRGATAGPKAKSCRRLVPPRSKSYPQYQPTAAEEHVVAPAVAPVATSVAQGCGKTHRYCYNNNNDINSFEKSTLF